MVDIDFLLSRTIALCGVELKDVAAGRSANLIRGITSSGGFLFSRPRRGCFSKWLGSSYAQPVNCNAIMMLENTGGEIKCVQQEAHSPNLALSMGVPTLKIFLHCGFISSSPSIGSLLS